MHKIIRMMGIVQVRDLLEEIRHTNVSIHEAVTNIQL